MWVLFGVLWPDHSGILLYLVSTVLSEFRKLQIPEGGNWSGFFRSGILSHKNVGRERHHVSKTLLREFKWCNSFLEIQKKIPYNIYDYCNENFSFRLHLISDQNFVVNFWKLTSKNIYFGYFWCIYNSFSLNLGN